MSSVRLSSQYVEVQLEIGHRATPKLKITQDGHTHDWTVFVRGPESSNIQHFVEKVVFHLHESFPKPKRVVKEPPYQVSESGYAGFELPVEVYFKNKEEPKKICFDYDLYLRLDDAVSNTRREKLTFQNPSNDFKKKLLKAGGATNESNGATAKSSTDEKQNTTLSSNISTNFSKSNKAHINIETKKTKTSGVIPSKDKSLNSQQQHSLPIPPPLPPTQEKPHISAPNNQFTDLFGPPIQKTCDAKNKDKSKTKSTPTVSKEFQNDTKNKKKPAKNSFLAPAKDIKDISESKANKEYKNASKSKESTKAKSNKGEPSDKPKKKFISSPIAVDSNDKKPSDVKESKKRRHSTSSNSSSVTCSSHSGNTDSKHYKDYSPKLGSTKDQENKKESKRQKVSSKDTASGVKKHSSSTTKISFSDNNTSTTIEIKSVKKEKTWDSEVKKLKSKEFKTSEFKSAKENMNSNSSGNVYSTSKSKSKEETSGSQKSPKMNVNKNLKLPKEKSMCSRREVSSSPSSGLSGSFTPVGVTLSSSSSIHGPLNSMFADMDQSLSPLSSDPTPTSPLRFDRSSNVKNCTNNYTNNNDRNESKKVIANDLFSSDDSDSSDSIKRNTFVKSSPYSTSKPNNKIHNSSKGKQLQRKKKELIKDNMCDTLNNDTTEPLSSLKFHDSVLYTDLIEIHKKLNESTDPELLQKIVDIIEDSGLYTMTSTSFDFDLIKLDKTTIQKIKTFLN